MEISQIMGCCDPEQTVKSEFPATILGWCRFTVPRDSPSGPQPCGIGSVSEKEPILRLTELTVTSA